MIIRRLHLHPFAGTADRDQRFQAGLNVILGPNEAGKTSLRNALWQALFVSTKLTKREKVELLTPYLPLSGGDTIRVSVDLEAEGGTWRLSKQWSGGGGVSELKLPDGGLITDPESVDAELENLLVLKPGTWRHALFVSQGGTASALEDILVEGSAVEDLSEVLRRTGFETDRVSIESLGEQIERMWDGAFGRWDRGLNRPENNRGLENPWRQNVGSILKSWYELEEARKAVEEAEAYYHDLDTITEGINAAAAASESLKSWVATHTTAASDAERRIPIEAKLEGVKSKEGTLRGASQDWPVANSRADEWEKRAAELQESARVLAEEQRRAGAWEAASQKRTVLGQAKGLGSRITEAREALEKTPAVDEDQINELENLERERDRIRARLEAAELKLTFTAKKAIDVEVQAGVTPAEKQSLAKDEVFGFTAGARAVIRHDAWAMEVQSGDIDVTAEEARYREVQKSVTNLLLAIGADDLTNARKLLSDFTQRANHLSGLELQLQELLGEQTLDALQAQVDAAGGGEAPQRSAAVVAAEWARAETAAGSARGAATELRRKILEWEGAYGSQEGLLDQLLELRSELKEMEKTVGDFQPLPEGFNDAQDFLETFRAKKEALDEARGGFNALLVERATLEGRAPELEPAEANERLDQAQAAFERASHRAAAIDRIRSDFEGLRMELDQGTLQPWLEHLPEIVAPLSGQRYNTIDLDGHTFFRANTGTNIPFQVLSMGTRACLGLAVRLSMARWFLQDRKGFLVLDDPLVDLDPERQQAAAAILKKFAEEKQIILMTCHPLHAEVLGAETIEM